MKETYRCKTCGRTYRSPIPLHGPPVCSGQSRAHRPVDMGRVKS